MAGDVSKDSRRAARAERGANLMEYVVLLLGVVLVAILAVRAVGNANAPLFQPANDAFQQGGGDPPVDPAP